MFRFEHPQTTVVRRPTTVVRAVLSPNFDWIRVRSRERRNNAVSLLAEVLGPTSGLIFVVRLGDFVETRGVLLRDFMSR